MGGLLSQSGVPHTRSDWLLCAAQKGLRWFAGFSIFLGVVLGVLAFYTYLYFVASSPTAERPSVWAALLGLTVVIAAGTIAWRADTREYLEN